MYNFLHYTEELHARRVSLRCNVAMEELFQNLVAPLYMMSQNVYKWRTDKV